MTPFDCPRCAATLTMTERHGIEIDYCPQCRGVWLDRGELDKILDRVADQPPVAQPQPPTAAGWVQPTAAWSPPTPDYGYRRDDERRDSQHGRGRKSWLSELFD